MCNPLLPCRLDLPENELPCLQVLFAICHEQEPLGEIEKLAGQTIALQTSAAGGVSWEVVESAADVGSGASQLTKAARQKLQVGQGCQGCIHSHFPPTSDGCAAAWVHL